MEAFGISCLCRTHHHAKGRCGSCSLYIVRAPASSSRLALAEDGLLKYLAKGSIPNDRCDPLFEPNGQILDPLEWIAKLTMHIPDHGSQTIRYCGRYSNVSRAKAARCAQLADHTTQAHVPKDDSESEWLKERKSTWAALIKLIGRLHLHLLLALPTSPWIRLSGPNEIKSQPIQPPGSIP